jgi:hypothetical protein
VRGQGEGVRGEREGLAGVKGGAGIGGRLGLVFSAPPHLRRNLGF